MSSPGGTALVTLSSPSMAFYGRGCIEYRVKGCYLNSREPSGKEHGNFDYLWECLLDELLEFACCEALRVFKWGFTNMDEPLGPLRTYLTKDIAF